MRDWKPNVEIMAIQPTDSVAEMEAAISDVQHYVLAGLCIPPFWVKKVRRDLGDHPASLATVIGFPFGYQRTEAKITEIEAALADGATDLEVTLNASALRSPSAGWIKIELAKCARLAHDRQIFLTVLIEPAFMEEKMLRKVCGESADAGVDFVKLGLGLPMLAPVPSLAQVELVRKSLPALVGLKVAQPIHSLETVRQLLDIGVERVGIAGRFGDFLNHLTKMGG